MDQYEFVPARVRRPNDRRRAAVLATVAAVLVTIAALKPWEGAAVGGPVGQTAPVVAMGSSSPSPASTPIPTPTDASIRAWPVRTVPPSASAGLTQQAERLIPGLASHAGTWGVGSAGIGPRILREEPWTDWVAVAPANVEGALGRMAAWPDMEACTDAPAVFDRPSLIGITVPAAMPPTWRMVGWWTDGTYVVDLTGSIRALSPPDSHGIGYFERVDGGPWPAGRYEFRVIAGDQTLALTVCLTGRA